MIFADELMQLEYGHAMFFLFCLLSQLIIVIKSKFRGFDQYNKLIKDFQFERELSGQLNFNYFREDNLQNGSLQQGSCCPRGLDHKFKVHAALLK